MISFCWFVDHILQVLEHYSRSHALGVLIANSMIQTTGATGLHKKVRSVSTEEVREYFIEEAS